jgi:hypothetical protein
MGASLESRISAGWGLEHAPTDFWKEARGATPAGPMCPIGHAEGLLVQKKRLIQ